MYFSDAFAIVRDADDDWFDPILSSDTKLFVDPFLVFKEESSFWAQAHDDLIGHFNTCFRLIAQAGGNTSALPYRKAMALLHFPEPKEFCLGYTESGIKGAGGGHRYAVLIAAAMEAAIARGVEDLRHFEELGVLNEGIGPDRISDLACNVLRSYFIRYTQQITQKHSLGTKWFQVGGARFDPMRQNWESQDIDLPENPYSHGPVLLIPSRFLRELPTLNADDWWDNVEAEQLRNDLNYEFMGRVSKGEIVAAARRNPGDVRAWTEAKEDRRGLPYDFSRDPSGVWTWLQEARVFASTSPLVIAPPADEAAFSLVIETVIERFRTFVEEQGGWKLLWNDGSVDEKPEEAAQLLFKGLAMSYCEANNVVLDREVNLGRGPVDFKFSNGYSHRALLEVKKLHNGRFWHGLEAQLPSYLRSDDCNLGWFLAIRYRDLGTTLDWQTDAREIVRKQALNEGIRLHLATIDGRPKPSASRS